MTIEIDLEQKVAVVTGASRGIGKAIAVRLAEAGADVVLAARTTSQLKETMLEIQALGGQAIMFPMDVTQKSAVEKLMITAVEGFGGLHILVNNAAIMTPGPLIKHTNKDWDRVISVNLKSYFLCTKAAGHYMLKQKYGKIVNLASTGGVIAGPNNASYHTSKAGIIHFTRAIAIEWIKYNINVNAIGPGFVDTELTDTFIQKGSRKTALKAIPINRFAEPKEIANLAVFLASDLSDYFVGEHVIIDGGLTIP
jgi:NAD(P)-dependent dehydrogenase (short-subunit alcohol dehydrogenase family)